MPLGVRVEIADLVGLEEVRQELPLIRDLAVAVAVDFKFTPEMAVGRVDT
jgi:hypothetical protein